MKNLTGSEKQIAWATKIRDAFVASLDALREDVADNIDWRREGIEETDDAGLIAEYEQEIEKLQKNLAWAEKVSSCVLENEDAAIWWIDHRNHTAKTMARTARTFSWKID